MVQALTTSESRKPIPKPISFSATFKVFFDKSATFRAINLIDRLPSDIEKAAVASKLLKSGTLSEPAQEMFASVLIEHGNYQQLVSVMDSGKVACPTALKLVKDKISEISRSVITPPNKS
ncbi:TPA: hypothetical protein HA238_05955 [Candidatus Micrarchaeota archaeon]|nr:hypothetical protein [Candidatus Micrarchaeota archaeon]